MLNAKKIYDALKAHYPNAKISLKVSNPLETLVAVMLSAQCTDKIVNRVTKSLFKKYKTVEDYANCKLDDLKKDIRQTGFYNSKAKHIKESCRIILEKHNGIVPKTISSLVELPGVGRKTANIVVSSAYGIIEGIAVDTHMARVNYRLGLTKNTNPKKIEQDLMGQLPKKLWYEYPHLIIAHGRSLCKAPVPICSQCFLNKICPKIGVKKKK